MTAEELIIGHYEKTLTTEQESHLAAMVAGSPDIRGLFEQHGNIHGLMVDDAAKVETTSKLDKVVLGAALGTIAEIAGHGVGFSLLGKVASVVGALAVGGVGVVLYNNANDDDAAMRDRQRPAIERPAVTNTASPSTNASNSDGVLEATSPSETSTNAPAPTPSRSEAPSVNDVSKPAATSSVIEKPKPSNSGSGLKLGADSVPVVVQDTNTKMRPSGSQP